MQKSVIWELHKESLKEVINMNFPNPTVDYLERDNNLEKNLYSNKESRLYEKIQRCFPMK